MAFAQVMKSSALAMNEEGHTGGAKEGGDPAIAAGGGLPKNGGGLTKKAGGGPAAMAPPPIVPPVACAPSTGLSTPLNEQEASRTHAGNMSTH